MNSNPYFIERMMKDKVAELREEGMRDQMYARAGVKSPAIRFPDLRRPFRRLIRGWSVREAPWIEQHEKGVL